MERWHVLTAGAVTSLVGFASSAMVVIAGLSAVGASPAQAASGLAALCVVQGICTIAMSHRYRMPILVVWSTPGAALLAGTGAATGNWPASVGAFIATGLLVLLTGLWPRLGALIAAIPTSIAQAMLAGVLLELCLAPVHGVIDHPVLLLPPTLVWLVLLRLAPRWSVPAAFAAAIATIGIWVQGHGGLHGDLLPSLEPVAPHFSASALLTIALPLYVVTMASQNVPGVAVLRSLGYEVPWRPAMLVTGAGSLLGAPLGGHGINLAAISAALAAGPEAGEDRSRRWIASLTSGIVMVVLGVLASAAAQLVALAPEGVVPAVAGLALLGTFVAAVKGALAREEEQLPAGITLLVAASGIAVAGISAAFWALLAGLVVRSLLRARPRR